MLYAFAHPLRRAFGSSAELEGGAEDAVGLSHMSAPSAALTCLTSRELFLGKSRNNKLAENTHDRSRLPLSEKTRKSPFRILVESRLVWGHEAR